MSQNDHRNGVWLAKRAHYLAHIAVHAQSAAGQELVQDIRWTEHMGEPLRPSLLITPVIGGKAFRWSVQLLPVPAADHFKIHTFGPQKQNIKHTGGLVHIASHSPLL